MGELTCMYQGKRWRIIDSLPSGNLVLQRWMWGHVGFWTYPYRSVIITSIDTVEMK